MSSSRWNRTAPPNKALELIAENGSFYNCMPTPILATKLYLPRLRPNVVSRPRLLERLNAGLHRKLTLIAAPAGFGKTTLVSRSEEHTSELQSPCNLVCRLLLEKKKQR